ncbi:MAG: flagellar brake protein [Fimbriimonadaceae bacterium]|nr:flagellar brake protein [Fimbriimonadaceae bacterium]
MLSQLAELVGYLAILFAGSLAVGYVLATRRCAKGVVRRLEPGSKVRVRSSDQIYRTRFVAASDEGWVFAAPLARDRHVPLRVGERVVIESACETGLVLWRTEVLARAMNPHTFTVRTPEPARPQNRRREPRLPGNPWPNATLDGHPAELLDVSPRGCRVLTELRRPVGSTVQVRLGFTDLSVEALVMSAEAVGGRDRLGLRFERPILVPLEA